jgi:UDP-glucose 4-epimerase
VPYDEAYAPGFEDMQRRVPSLEKISRLTGYKPCHSLDDILQRVIAYEKDRLDT